MLKVVFFFIFVYMNLVFAGFAVLEIIVFVLQTETQGSRSAPSMSFVDYQTSMVQTCKRIAQVSQEMLGKASSPETSSELGHMANILTKLYGDLAEQQQGASAACPSADVSYSHIRLFIFNIVRFWFE